MSRTGNRPATGLAAPCRTRLPLPPVPHHPNRLLQQPVSHRRPRSGADGRDPSSDSLPRQAAHSMRGVAAAVPPPRPERRAAKSSAHHRFRTSASGAAYPLESRIPIYSDSRSLAIGADGEDTKPQHRRQLVGSHDFAEQLEMPRDRRRRWAPLAVRFQPRIRGFKQASGVRRPSLAAKNRRPTSSQQCAVPRHH